jgi:hypothetical protein
MKASPRLNSRSARVAVLTGLLILAMVPSIGRAEDSSGARLDAAHRYARAADLPKVMNDMVQQMALTLPADKRQSFIEFMGTMDAQRLEAMTVAAMVQHFTTDEIEALAAFYDSAVGRSIMKKMPVYMATLMPSLQAMLLEKAREFPR